MHKHDIAEHTHDHECCGHHHGEHDHEHECEGHHHEHDHECCGHHHGEHDHDHCRSRHHHEHEHEHEQVYTWDAFTELVAIVALLRSEQGCPWDREQTHESIAKNMIEEAYEAVEAIEQGDAAALKEELGDVLLQVVLHAQIALDTDEFTLEEVVNSISNKLISRHPHVFGNEASFAAAGYTEQEIAMIEEAIDAESTLKLWDRVKTIEKQRRAAEQGSAPEEDSLLSSVPKHEPALMQAQNISRKAAAQGFEWQDIEGLTAKLAEEFEEFAEAEVDTPEAEEEFGDILFTLVNVARWNNIDAESALRRSCEKFRTRWQGMEQIAHEEGISLRELTEEEWDDLWKEVKQRPSALEDEQGA